MRVGVIRGDVPSPILLADLEPTSQFNPPTEPFGQTRYVSRPSTTALTNYLAGVYAADSEGNFVGDVGDADNAEFTVGVPTTLPIPGFSGVPAGVESSAAVTFPVVITGANDTLQVKNVSTAGFTTVTVASGSYATMAALITAINAVLVPSGIATAASDATGTLVVIQSSIPGVGSYIDIGAGTINTPLNLGAPSPSNPFTMPAATAIIAAMNPAVIPPATGSINVSPATILATLGASPAAASVANLIAPQFQETEVAVQSFQVGNMSKFLELTWNPDPRHGTTVSPGFPPNLPYTNGPAIQVVANDGHTPFTAPLPMITAAVHNVPAAGDITITGVGLANSEYNYPVQPEPGAGTVVTVTAAASTAAPGSGAGVNSLPKAKLTQRLITKPVSSGTQGTISSTSIVIPASLLTTVEGIALGVAGSTVTVKFETFANSNYGTAATIASTSTLPYVSADGSIKNHVLATLTGLADMQPSSVGQPLVISGAASFQNNGEFIIQAWISASSVVIFNDSAVAPDANNGAISWSQPGPVPFPLT